MKITKLTKMAMCLAAASAIALPGGAWATTISGVTFAPGSTLVIGTLYEGNVASGYSAPITGAGQELGGVGIVDAIKDSGGVTVWSNGDNGTELTFKFGGYMSEAPVFFGGPFTPPIGINFSGGWVNFFAGSGLTQNFVTSPVATALANAVDGTPWLNLLGGSTGVFCAGAAANCTLQSFITAGSLLVIGAGSGSGFLDVDMTGAGLANSSFDTNTQPLGHDITLGSSFNSASATGAFAASGSLDMRGVTIPEPESLALLGIGLLGLAMTRRGRKQA